MMPATCTDAMIELATCKTCAATAVRPSTDAAYQAMGHAFMDYRLNGDATCTEAGTATATCARCDATDTHPGADPLGHMADPTVEATVSVPGCTTQGYATYLCQRCGLPYQDDFVSATGHRPEHEADIAPTCTKAGYKGASRCSVYGEALSERTSIAPLGHRPEHEADVAPTCTEAGYKGASRCSVCGETLSERVSVAPLGHSFSGRTANGNETHSSICARCGDRRTVDCVYGNIDVAGIAVRVCGVCGDVIDPTGGKVAAADLFTPIPDATGEEPDAGAIPEGTELIVRKFDVSFGDEVEAIEAFTIAYETDGIVLPLEGRVRVSIPLVLDIAEPFRLVRVDVTPETETTPSSEVWVQLDYDYADGVLTFVSDRDGLFLLVPMDAILRS